MERDRVTLVAIPGGNCRLFVDGENVAVVDRTLAEAPDFWSSVDDARGKEELVARLAWTLIGRYCPER